MDKIFNYFNAIKLGRYDSPELIRYKKWQWYGCGSLLVAVVAGIFSAVTSGLATDDPTPSITNMVGHLVALISQGSLVIASLAVAWTGICFLQAIRIAERNSRED